MRIGEHSDYGTITLLWQINDVPGLQVQDLGRRHGMASTLMRTTALLLTLVTYYSVGLMIILKVNKTQGCKLAHTSTEIFNATLC